MRIALGLTEVATMAVMMSDPAGNAAEPTPDAQVVYKTIGETQLRLHVFNPPHRKATDKRACVVFFFGGGWVAGLPSQFYPHCRYLALRGMVALSAEYRVKSRHGTTPYECVKDGKSAIRWIRAHAAELGVDPNRIAAGGGSAGGHVAAAAGTVSAFEEQGEDQSVSSRPNALVLFNPAFDNGPDGFGYGLVREHWQQLSPIHNITKESPPTVVFLGTKDAIIPVATAQKYHDLMTRAGRRCDLHLYDGQPHGFFNYRNGKNPFYAATLAETDKFLTSLGYLKAQPTPRGKQAGATPR